MYIVTFTAHQQRNMVWTPHFFGAGDATGSNNLYYHSFVHGLVCNLNGQCSWICEDTS